MKYPITPDYLDDAPIALVNLYGKLEADLLTYICEQFNTGEANASALEAIRMLQRRGLDLDKIEEIIQETTGLAEKELDKIFTDAVKRNNSYYSYVKDKYGLVKENANYEALQAEIMAIEAQTKDTFKNLTRTMGFALRNADGSVSWTNIGTAFQKVLDDATIAVWTGADYKGAIRTATRQLANSGLQWVDYKNGWHNRIEVAVRRAVMTGITQISARYSENLAEEIQTDYVEVTAHRGARDTGTGIENHKSWQGKIYRFKQLAHARVRIEKDGKPKLVLAGSENKYPDLVTSTGYGTGAGLCGWNCRHHFHPFVPGVMEPTYTQEELDNIDPPPFTFEGKQYTMYEATQKQRQVEAAMRNIQRRMITADAAGDYEQLQTSAIKYQRLKQEYEDFCEAADLRTQEERGYITEWGPGRETSAQRIARGIR